jgi:hypothetical protein
MTIGIKTSAALALVITVVGPAAAGASDPIPSNYQLVETIPIPPDGSAVNSTTVLTSGVTYWLRVSGSDTGAGDAEYDLAGNDRCAIGGNERDVGVAAFAGLSSFAPGAALVSYKLPFWGVFDPTHVYTSQVTGRGRTLLVSYSDCVYGDNVGGLTLELFGPGSTARPGCDVVFDVQEFTEGGQPVTAKLIRLTNDDAQSVTVEFKLWLRLPGLGPLSLVNVGADSRVQLPAHFHHDSSNVILFPVTPATPRGTYELACVVGNPVTGEIFSRRIDRFAVR